MFCFSLKSVNYIITEQGLIDQREYIQYSKQQKLGDMRPMTLFVCGPSYDNTYLHVARVHSVHVFSAVAGEGRPDINNLHTACIIRQQDMTYM